MQKGTGARRSIGKMTSMHPKNLIVLEIAAVLLGIGLASSLGANTALLLGAGAVGYVAMKEKVVKVKRRR